MVTSGERILNATRSIYHAHTQLSSGAPAEDPHRRLFTAAITGPRRLTAKAHTRRLERRRTGGLYPPRWPTKEEEAEI